MIDQNNNNNSNDRLKNAMMLLNALKEGRESGEKEGYISLEELRKKYS